MSTRIIGHRGARGLWPENSLAGFRNAIELDLDAIEFDIHLTRAGELVVIHDPVVEATSEDPRPVADLSSTDRAAIRLGESEETLPTLDEVLTVLSAAPGIGLHVEIKSSAHKEPYPGIVEAVVAAIDRFRLRSRCHLTTFDLAVLAECERVAADIPRLVSIDEPWAERQGGVATVLDQAADHVDIVTVKHTVLTPQWDLVTSVVPLERLGVWIVNEPEEIAAWLDRGLGYLTTDRPDLALAVRAASSSRTHPRR